MLTVVYLLTSKWHDVEKGELGILAVVDVFIVYTVSVALMATT
jgi:hypothetical protein